MRSFVFQISVIFALGAGVFGSVYAYEYAKTTDVGGLRINAEWLVCEQDTECELVFSGCAHYTPVNKQYIEQVTKIAYEAFGDPREISCESATNATQYTRIAKCISKACALEEKLIEEK
jgi:hypothetical protein